MNTGGELAFPPLMRGEMAIDCATSHAVMRATSGCDAGLIAYRLKPAQVEAALVFAPEVPLKQAVAMLPACGLGLQNALGALAPPGLAVHLEWGGGIRINGAACGRLATQAAGSDPDAVPDWLVVGFKLPLLPEREDTGSTPEQTTLHTEGCANVAPRALLESWARHTLAWISRWTSEGIRPLVNEWRGLAFGIGEAMSYDGLNGTYLGVDENFGMLLRDDAVTHLVPLTKVLDATP